MKHIFRLLLLPLLLLASGCGGSDSFIVEGDIQGLGTRGLRIYYFTDAGMKVGITSATDGKFKFEGSSRRPSILTIATAQRGIITSVVVSNGDYVKLGFTMNEPWSLRADGNAINSEISSFLEKNGSLLQKGDRGGFNNAIAGYVGKHPSEEASAVLLTLFYDTSLDPSGANRLMESIVPEKRASKLIEGYFLADEDVTREQMAKKVDAARMMCLADSLTWFNPADNRRTFIFLTDSNSAISDSINDTLETLAKTDSLAIVNISLEPDTASWHANRRELPLKAGISLWTPGATASPQLSWLSNASRLPMFVVVDSKGNKLYEGESLKKAVSHVD